jgi:2-polyprenyl-3-methyl-5-hydroxy-6-metoxy-1,4-benzoquinol methylase
MDPVLPAETMWSYVRCRGCDVVYLTPRPSAGEMQFHYPQEYYRLFQEVVRRGEEQPLMRFALRVLRRRRLPGLKPGRVLDIGCGSGFYLAALREAGWDGEGIEPGETAAQFARKHCGLPVHNSNAEEALAACRDGSFDLVTMWHVLEHLPDPAKALAEVRRILRPGGTLMLEVPNFSSIWSVLFRSRWAALEAPRHFFQFTPETLARTIRGAGLRVVRVHGLASPMTTCASMNLMWQQWTGAPSTLKSVYRPNLLALAAAWPPEWFLSHFGLSNELTAVAVRGNQ